jgi:hypothetical protein
MRRNHNPPQRSQYLSSTWANLFFGFFVMTSPVRLKIKRALRRFPGHRARFSYVDLLGLFSYELQQVQIGSLPRSFRQLRTFRAQSGRNALTFLLKVTLLVAGLEDPAILHDHA